VNSIRPFLKEREVVEIIFRRWYMEKELVQHRELLKFQPKTSFTIICKSRVVNIAISEITHVSKYGCEVVIYTRERQYRTCHSLQEIMNDLPVNDFFKGHRSHIIALSFMKSVKRKRIQVGEYYLPVSKYYKKQMCDSLATLLNRNYIFFQYYE
jgi:DNA-binding LytR/AlgR family response regulator